MQVEAGRGTVGNHSPPVGVGFASVAVEISHFWFCLMLVAFAVLGACTSCWLRSECPTALRWFDSDETLFICPSFRAVARPLRNRRSGRRFAQQGRRLRRLHSRILFSFSGFLHTTWSFFGTVAALCHPKWKTLIGLTGASCRNLAVLMECRSMPPTPTSRWRPCIVPRSGMRRSGVSAKRPGANGNFVAQGLELA